MKPGLTPYWPMDTILLLPGGISPVLLLFSVATPMSVRPAATTPGIRFIRSTIFSACGISW